MGGVGVKEPGMAVRRGPKRETGRTRSGDPLRRLVAFVPPLRYKLGAAALCLAAASLLALCYATLVNRILDAIGARDPHALNHAALLAVAVFGARALVSFGQSYFLANSVQRLAMQL